MKLEPLETSRLLGLRRPSTPPGGPKIVLLHGYGGDEKVMWVFYAGIPTTYEILAFRGVYPSEEGGYQWHMGRRWPPPPAQAFALAVEAIGESIDREGSVVWVGFSQGAALAFCCAAAGLPTRAVASLAGYLPEDLGSFRTDLRVFWAHGRNDERVSIEWARLAVERLRSWGAEVELCESDTGHKVSADCLRSLRLWLDGLSPFRAPTRPHGVRRRV